MDALDRARALCAALPEVECRSDAYADAYEVRRRAVAYVFEADGVPLLVVNADPDEIRALVASGHPWFAPGSGRNRLGVVLDDGVDWDELAELVADSYRRVAPKRLAALLDQA